jgi:hypothetical protein
MGTNEFRDEIRVRRYSGRSECDLVVTFRGREMVGSWPMIITPATDADHFHVPRWMP